MILDKIENRDIYSGLSEAFQKAFDYITETDFSNLSGEYEIDGRDIYAIVSSYNTKKREDCKPEGHRKYIDLQYMIEGEEEIGYLPFENQKVIEEYDPEKDLVFYDGDGSFFEFKKGMFSIFFPEDLHMPGAGSGSSVKKAVIKIKL